ALSAVASRPRPSSIPILSFRKVSSDAIHTDFFPFSAGPYYATYPEDGVGGNCKFTREEWDSPYRPTFGVLMKEVFKDPTVCKTIIDQFPTPGKMVQLLARYHGLNQSHNEYVLSTYSRLKGYEEKVLGLSGLELQVSALKKQHSEVAYLSVALNQATVLEAEKDEEILRLKANPLEFSSFFHAASVGFKHGLSMHQTKDEFAAVLKKMANFMPGAQDRLAKASPLEACVSPPTKESTVTPASKSLELSANVNFTASVVSPEHNEEMVNVKVDGVSGGRVGRVSSGPNDVVVALSAGENGDGLDPSSATGKEAAANPSRV
ncbi:hypothetical protein Tco_1431524, partial [Tanacetum coccineum]